MMRLFAIAGVLFAIEVLLYVLMVWAGNRCERQRKLVGSSEPVTMASSPILALCFFYHMPMLVAFVASPRFSDTVKALATYVGTPLLYFLLIVATGRHGLQWHGL